MKQVFDLAVQILKVSFVLSKVTVPLRKISSDLFGNQ